MSRRFNNLEDVINTFTQAQIEALPATNKYRKYYEWKRDPEKRKLPETSVPERKRSRSVAVSPFGQTFDADKKVIVAVSGRSFDKLTDLGGATLFNLQTSPSATSAKLSGFIPAKAILSQRLASSQTVPASSNRITGRAYKTSAGSSYTMPFGRSSANSVEFSVQNDIMLGKSTDYIITFTPERLKQR